MAKDKAILWRHKETGFRSTMTDEQRADCTDAELFEPYADFVKAEQERCRPKKAAKPPAGE
jgi:hypothetical protein